METTNVLNTRIELVASQQMKICDKPLPPVPPHGLIIKTKFAGICHTDLHMYEDKFVVGDGVVVGCEESIENFHFPLVLGHEIAGEVFALGQEDCEGAPSLAIGDRVAVYPWNTGCYPQCKPCSMGYESLCVTKPLVSSFGLHTDGGWETYVVVERRSIVVLVPPGVGLDVACLVPCSGITALGAITNAMPVIEKSFHHKDSCSVLICGLGGVGMWAVGIAKAVLPPGTKIYVTDIEESKLQWATSEGVNGVIHITPEMDDKEAIKKILEITQGGVDVALDFVGNSATAKRLAGSLYKGGILVVIGIAGGMLTLCLLEVVFKDIIIRGSETGDKRMISQVFDLIVQNKVRPPPIDYCDLSIDNIMSVFKKLSSRQVKGRYVIKFS